jgi:hypothetical protein
VEDGCSGGRKRRFSNLQLNLLRIGFQGTVRRLHIRVLEVGDSLERVRGSPLVAQHDTPAAALTHHDASMAFREYSRSRCSSPSNASGVSRAVLNHAVQYSTIGEHECRRFQP